MGRVKGALPYILGFIIQVLIGRNFIMIKSAFIADMKFTVFLCYKNTVALFALLIAALYSRQTSGSQGLSLSLDHLLGCI
ncbi:hypothetical protein ACFX15_016714 [Malus domestica]